MSVRFILHPVAWEHPLARWTLETVAQLLELEWTIEPHGSEARSAGAPIFVGPVAAAPSGAAATIEFELWAEWDPDALALARFGGLELPCPAGTVPDAPAPVIDAEPLVPRVLHAGWLRSLGFLLTREEEFLDDRRDEWECFKGTWSRQHDLGVLDRPLVNLAAHQLETRAISWHRAQGNEPAPVPRWPAGAKFAVALTHDVDDVALRSVRGAVRLLARTRRPGDYALRGGLRALARSVMGGGPDPYDCFDRWVGEEERRGFHASYYFVPPDRARTHENDPTYAWQDRVLFAGARTTVAGMMQSMARRGCDVGLHGGYLSHRDSAELTRERRSVERAAAHAVAGGRQHFLRFDVRSTWDAQELAGLRYDSTLGYNEAIGFRAGIAAPFRPWDPARRAARGLIELPLTVMDGTLFRTLALDPAHAVARVREHLERVEHAGGLAVLLWHPNAAAEQWFPGWWDCWIATLDWLATRNAWVTSAAAVAEWWRARGNVP